MQHKNTYTNPEKASPENEKQRKPGKSAHIKRGSTVDSSGVSSGGSRQGNAGQDDGEEGSFGHR